MRALVASLALLMLTSISVSGAEYEGDDIDGESFSCTAFSYSTSKHYDGNCEFDGDEVTFTFHSGKSITLTLDDEEIDDPDSISAYDYKRGNVWDLDVDLD